MSEDTADTELTPRRVRETLQSVTDPDLDGDVVATGVVEGIDVTDGTVTVDASFTGLSREQADDLVETVRQSVFSLPGVERVRVSGDTAGADEEQAEVRDVGRILAVASAKGGVGKTTVATQLARGLASRGESVGLFDADIYGPNVPDLLGVDGPVESTPDGAARPLTVDDLQVMSVGCIANDEPLAWRGAMAHEVVLELLNDSAWDGVDTLVVDLPPGTGDIVLTVLQSVTVDGVVLVTTPFPTAASDTGRSATLFREQGVPVLGTVVNMAGFTCPSCGDDHAPFGDDAAVDDDVLAELPIDEDLRVATGSVPDEFRTLADEVGARLDDASRFDVPDHALDLRGVPDRAALEQFLTEFETTDSGEFLFTVTDRPPEPLVTALADRIDRDGGIDAETRRLGPETWAIKVTERIERHCSRQV